ncbi:cell surface protein SprA [Emticicia sp. TH156]|uniref:T9SS outer membrane translocon Sov/SprA n=1 Tax=Emticicia sp. TH156 TaxID=2067454 RepID=UPI000C7568B2|nr:cell surface protein SprA [Emticicia sp. TH156]PLK43825.1 cell surface protein SprA [Emticicia sp. TH156]
MLRQPFGKNYIFFYFFVVSFGLISEDAEAQIGGRRRNTTTKTDNSRTDSLAAPAVDTVIVRTGRQPAYRWQDRYLNRYSQSAPQSPFYLKDPGNIRNDFSISPNSKEISISEKAGKNLDYRIPQALSFNEYSSLQNAYVRKSLLREYENLQDGKSATTDRGLRPLLQKGNLVDRIFGSSMIEQLKPNGFVTLDFKVIHQFIDNPLLPIIQRRQTRFNFDEQININFNGQIGEKLGMLTNLDTKAAFNFENQLKLNFKNGPEDIIQKVEAGNISMPVKSQLIPGVQNLFGVKTAFTFGKLDVTAVVAQQRSKTESIILNGGAQNRSFEIRADNYEENRHFFLAQFFRSNYERALRNLPLVLSGVRVTRIEVYVTNRTNTVESMRNLIGFTSLGDTKSGNNSYEPVKNQGNPLYNSLVDNPVFRKIDDSGSGDALASLNLKKGIDYEVLRGAKRLTERDFKFNAELGYISLVTPLRNDEILAVAYEYTYNGNTYKVGELTEDYAIRPENEAIMLKLIKSSIIRNRTSDPMWDLMMKNIYSLGVPGVGKLGFQLRIIYKDDKTGIDNPNLQEGRNLKDVPLVRVMNMDNLNPNNDPQPGGDGNFDFIEDVTIDAKTGRLIFPVLEPFGATLDAKFDASEQALKDKYVFSELYRTTLADAQQVTTKNKFFIRGSLQASNSAEVPLPLGASPQSVRIFAGGIQLQDGIDYLIEPQLGRIRFLNQSVLNSSRQIKIDYERPDMFNTQIRMMVGTRLDFNLSKDIRIGATAMTLRESTPAFMTRTAIGQEPVNNTIVGLDINYRKDARFLTRWLDALPLIQTKEMSAIQFAAEYAKLFPAVNNKRTNGNAMIDDFEATRNINDLTRQPTRWRPGTVPESFQGSHSGYEYNYKRAKISVYTIDQTTYIDNGFAAQGTLPPQVQEAASQNLYEKAYNPLEIFPGRSIPTFSQSVPVNLLDVSYFPAERGMYNYNPNLTTDGYLNNPKQNFGSVMRGITADNDFDNANTEYLTFWMLDPFKDIVKDGSPNGNKINTTGGKLKFHLGDISEDLIPDGRNSFENGFPANESVSNSSRPVQTKWGFAPNVQFMTDAFDNQPGSREKQDVGLDGLSNAQERTFDHIKTFLDKLSPTAREKIEKDPSADDFKFFTDPEFTASQSLIERFKNYLGIENNSPPSNTNSATSPTLANSVTPDKEDINGDNTINDIENYYEYEINLTPGRLSVGNSYIVDQVSVNAPNGSEAKWYLFRVPVKQFTNKVGDINGFKSIRFMRMMLTDFEQPVVLRFASLQLESNQYRVYDKSLTETPQLYDAKFKMGVVNIEENGCGEDGQNCNIKEGKTPYKVPPGFIRDQDITQQQFNVKFNEQSMSLAVTDLRNGDSRGVFRNTRVDMLNYKRLRMFIHAENEANDQNKVGGAFIRIGTDLSQHYYEIEIPQLKLTPNGSIDENVIWPSENFIDVALQDLVALKGERNRNAVNINKPYSGTTTGTSENGTDGNTYKITVLGNPDLSAVLSIMIGLRNASTGTEQLKTYTIWANELRAYGFDQTSGDAAIMSANIKLADIATLSVNANLKTFGFGGVQDRISERARETGKGIGIASNVEMDKFFPEKWGLRIPFFVNFDKQTITPHFNPLDPDMPLENALNNITDAARREAYRRMVIDNSTRKGFNFSNVRKVKTKEDAKAHIYDIENFSFTYAQNNVNRSNILIDDYSLTQNRGGLTYQYQPKEIKWEPFKNNKKMERPFLYWLKDFNLSPVPTVMAFRTDFDRSFARTQLRNADLTTNGVVPYFEKYFLLNRQYDLQWNLSRSILFTYTATMNAVIDEPYGDNESKLLSNIVKPGRAKNFNQEMRFTYRLPLDKFFLLDWVTGDFKYNNNFNYQAMALNLADANGKAFGNTIRNGRETGIRGKIDFVKLYNKVKYLRFANSPNQERKRFTRTPGDDENLEVAPSNVAKSFTRLLMAVRGIDYDYSVIETTILPGFMPEPKFFGLDGSYLTSESMGFVLGNQYRNRAFINQADEKGWLSKTDLITQPYTQSLQRRFSYRTTIEPFKDFRMQISGNFSRGDSYQEYYVFNATSQQYERKSPIRTGNFGMSFWAFNTFFEKMEVGNNYRYQVFENMKTNREIIINRLNTMQAESGNGEAGAYAENSQDVLIPAFIAAYSGKDAKTLNLKRFPFSDKKLTMPMPNWRIDYTGLANLEPFNNVFSSIAISHSYTASYNVGNFTSSLLYDAQKIDWALAGYPLASIVNENVMVGARNLYLPALIMSTISLEEKFAPFIGVQFTTKSKISGRFDWNRERRAVLNLSNSQVAEYSSSDLVFNLGFRKSGVKLPLRGRDGRVVTLKNDLNFQFAFTIRDIKAIQRRLDGDPQPTQGNYNLQWGPRITYQVNKRVLLNFYVDHTNNTPFVTNFSYPRRTTTGGINLRFNLSDQ